MASESHPRSTNGREDKAASVALKKSAPPPGDEGPRAAPSSAQGWADQLGQALDIKGRIDRNPYGTLAAAVGVGYIMGGGFFTPLTGRIVRLGLKLGLRLAVLPMLNEQVLSAISEVLTGAPQEQAAAPGRRTRHNSPNSNEGT